MIQAGNVSGIWTLSESPYIITGNITVIAGQFLAIERGVVVKLSGAVKTHLSDMI
jgi:hypothetical protein